MTASYHKGQEASVHLVGPTRNPVVHRLARLGSAKRWREIAQLNYGTVQGDGTSLTGKHWIQPGWMLRLPIEPSPDVSARWHPRR